MSLWNKRGSVVVAHNDTTDRNIPGNHTVLAPSSNGAAAIVIAKADGSTPMESFNTTTGEIHDEYVRTIGADATLTSYPAASLVVAEDATGHAYTGNIGITGEAVSSGSDTATGVGGNAATSGAFSGRGVAGVGKVSATADTGLAIGGHFRSIDTHAGGENCAVYANAAGGATNHSFHGVAGDIHNEGGASIGDVINGNYSEIEADGTLVFHGNATVWNDINIGGLSLRVGGTAPSFQAFMNGIYGYRFEAATGSDMHGAFEVPHDYKEGTGLYVHVHWTPTTTNTGNIVWGFEYTIANKDATFPASATLVGTPVAASGVVSRHALFNIGTIAGTGITIGSVVAFRVYRQNAGTDTFTGRAFLHSVGIHYEIDTVGSRQITTK